MGTSKAKLLQGTLDMLILKALMHGKMHGYGVAKRIHQLAEDELTVEEGSLYPALHRLVQQGWISAEWGISENNQRARLLRSDPRRPQAARDGGGELGTALQRGHARDAQRLRR